MNAPSAPDVARRLADALEAGGIPYAIGGALAMAVGGFARATVDVDLDVFSDHDALPTVFAVLDNAGCELDHKEALRSAEERGDFRAYLDGMRVDVFVPSIPFYASVQTRIVEAPLVGRPAWFLAAEDLAVFKLLFFRSKDLLDLERLVAARGSSFDDAYVRRWLVDIVGEEDARVARWDRLLRELVQRGRK